LIGVALIELRAARRLSLAEGTELAAPAGPPSGKSGIDVCGIEAMLVSIADEVSDGSEARAVAARKAGLRYPTAVQPTAIAKRKTVQPAPFMSTLLRRNGSCPAIVFRLSVVSAAARRNFCWSGQTLPDSRDEELISPPAGL
jgi:hypothetical protein